MARRLRLLALVLTMTPLGCGLIAGLRDWEEGDPSTVPGQDGAPDTSSSNGEGGPGSDSGIDSATDATTDGAVVDDGGCDPSKPFGQPVVLKELDVSNSLEGGGRLSPDELHIYFSSNRPFGPPTATNILTADRTSVIGTFGTPRLVANVNPPADDNDYAPTVTGDGLTLYFTHETTTAVLYQSTRSAPGDPFGFGAVVLDESPAALVASPFLTEDGSKVYYVRRPSGGKDDIYCAPRPATGLVVGAADVTELNSADNDTAPTLSRDELTVYFASDRPAAGKVGSDLDIWVARRAAKGVAFDAPTRVVELASSSNDIPSWISADDCRLYIYGSRPVPGGSGNDQAVWLARRGR